MTKNIYIDRMLGCGIRLVGKVNDRARSVSVGIWVKAGSSTETEAQNGLSHFLEHMLFKGTSRRSTKQIAMDMDEIGAQINAFTAKECTCFYVNVIDEKLPEAVDCLTDIFVDSTMDEEELNREKGVILEEISMALDMPDDIAHETAASRFFEGTPLGKTILGPAENIRKAKRQDLFEYKRAHYRPENIVISAVGNFDEEALAELLERGLEKLDYVHAEEGSFDYSIWTPKKGFKFVEKDVEQAHICLSFPGIAYDDDRKYALSIISNALGGSMSSRLFQKIREEKGMAYSVFTYSSAYVGTGMFTLYAGASEANAEEVFGMMEDECRSIAKNGITEEEFGRSLSQLRGGFILSTESGSAIMNSLGKNAVLGRGVVSEEDILMKLASVDMDMVMQVAAEVFDMEKKNGVYVGRKSPTGIEKAF